MLLLPSIVIRLVEQEEVWMSYWRNNHMDRTWLKCDPAVAAKSNICK